MSSSRARPLALLAAVIALFAFGALVASSASAQGPGSEFCEEYPSAPGCETGPIDEGDTDDEGGDAAAPTAAGPTAGVGDGELPFTGYPLTALVLLLLVLLLLGLAIRAYLALRHRVAGDRAAGP